MRRLVPALLAPVLCLMLLATSAEAKLPVIKPASYPGMTTFNCRTDAITLQPGQNLNKYTLTKACPHPEVVKGPLDESVFAAGSDAKGFLTRFQPSMVEVKPSGRLVTPAVWDLHLHHVVWLPPGGGPMAAGEEKTIISQRQGYGREMDATANWGLLHMLHNLTAQPNRQVYLTWQIDWVPQTEPARTDISPVHGAFLNVANGGAYPVFDAERAFDDDGDGKFTFPDDVSSNPADPSYEERSKISPQRSWTVPSGYTDGVTLLSAGGHLHPGGRYIDLKVARDGPDGGTTAGDDPAEVKRVFRSDAHYWEPAGAVSWDVGLTVARRGWRIHLEPGDTISISATYNVRRASWYESMGIMGVYWTPDDDPRARDPFEDPSAARAMLKKGGALTHRRLPENIDTDARKNLKLPDPRKVIAAGRAPAGGIDIDSFFAEAGGFSAVPGFPASEMRPPVIRPGGTVTFNNQDAYSGQPQDEQVWHTVTACRAPCNKGTGIGYPLANGPVEFDSGQLGFATGLNSNVTTGSGSYTTPPLGRLRQGRNGKRIKRGTTYTYFCRLHPFMRGSFRVRGPLNRE